MKKLKYYLTAIMLLALFVASFSFTGCEKEKVDTGAKDPVAPTAIFKKQLSLQTADGKLALLEVGASEKALLDQMEAKQFEVVLNPKLEEGAEEPHNEANEDQPIIMPSKYVTVQLLGAYSGEEITGYAVHFGEELQNILHREKAGMEIILTPSDFQPNTRTAGWRYIPGTSMVKLENWPNSSTSIGAKVYRQGGYTHTLPPIWCCYWCDRCSHTHPSLKHLKVNIYRGVPSSFRSYTYCHP
jgi:hypothetical protein